MESRVVAHHHAREPIQTPGLYVDCAGEYVAFEGPVNVNESLTVTPTGAYHYHLEVNAQGVVGTGATSGEAYRVSGGFLVTDSNSPSPGRTFTVIDRTRVTGRGPGNDFWLLFHRDVTVDATGELRAAFVRFTTSCD